jgi:hypothetical protein
MPGLLFNPSINDGGLAVVLSSRGEGPTQERFRAVTTCRKNRHPFPQLVGVSIRTASSFYGTINSGPVGDRSMFVCVGGR